MLFYMNHFLISRNGRYQADYGLLYMSKIVVASDGITLDGENEKLNVRREEFVREIFEIVF